MATVLQVARSQEQQRQKTQLPIKMTGDNGKSFTVDAESRDSSERRHIFNCDTGSYAVTRLTNMMRDSIVAKAINKKFDPIREKHKQQEYKLGMELYRHVFSLKIRNQVKELPLEWQNRLDRLRFNCAGYQLDFRLNDFVPVPVKKYSYDLIGAVTGELAAKAQKHGNECQDLKNQENDLRNKLSAMLHSIHTIKQLKETWPEGLEFYKIYETKPDVVQLPATQMTEINAALGLKSSK